MITKLALFYVIGRLVRIKLELTPLLGRFLLQLKTCLINSCLRRQLGDFRVDAELFS